MDPPPQEYQGIPLVGYIGAAGMSNVMFYGPDRPVRESPSDTRHGLRAQLDITSGGVITVGVSVGNPDKSDAYWEVRTFAGSLISDSSNPSFPVSPGSYMFLYTQPLTYDGSYTDVISVEPPISEYHDRPAYDSISLTPSGGAVIRNPQFGAKPATITFSPPIIGYNGDDPPGNDVYIRLATIDNSVTDGHLTFSVISTEV
jgi:hypothetical protein